MFALTALYGALRILDGADPAGPRRAVRGGRDERGAAPRHRGVRASAPLSLRFHLERKTGGLTRVLERGRTAIETIIRTAMLTAVPTAIEFALIVGAFLITFDWRYVARC